MEVNDIKNMYPSGTRIELEYIDDDFTNLGAGDCGTVKNVDDIGQIHISWDCGLRLALTWGEDEFRIIK